jgi:hypothetical protein
VTIAATAAHAAAGETPSSRRPTRSDAPRMTIIASWKGAMTANPRVMPMNQVRRTSFVTG